jgi:hypothetical protein
MAALEGRPSIRKKAGSASNISINRPSLRERNAILAGVRAADAALARFEQFNVLQLFVKTEQLLLGEPKLQALRAYVELRRALLPQGRVVPGESLLAAGYTTEQIAWSDEIIASTPPIDWELDQMAWITPELTYAERGVVRLLRRYAACRELGQHPLPSLINLGSRVGVCSIGVVAIASVFQLTESCLRRPLVAKHAPQGLNSDESAILQLLRTENTGSIASNTNIPHGLTNALIASLRSVTHLILRK